MEVIKDIKLFAPPCGINLDKDERLLEINEHREIWNSIVNTSEGSNIGCLENIKGTTNVFELSVNETFTPPSTGTICIGACEDIEENAIIYFICDTTGSGNHGILRMFINNYKCEWILHNQTLLNFQEDYKISSANRIGDLLYWTDGYEGEAFVDFNPPRKINVVKAAGMTNSYSSTEVYYPGQIVQYGLKAYRFVGKNPKSGEIPYNNTSYWEIANVHVYEAITDQILDRIKYPPYELASVSYETDPSINTNMLRNRLFRFSYRYVFDDGEKSTWSPISDVPMPLIYERFDGSYTGDNYLGNIINVWVDTGSHEVDRIEIAVQDSENTVWRLVNRKYKYDEDGDILLADNIFAVFHFYNTEVGEALNQEDFFRPYDAVPQIANHEELIEKNRIIDADYVEGFDNINIDIELENYNTDSGLLITYIPGIAFTEETWPPAYPVQGFPKYAKGIKWNVGVVQDFDYPISPQSYSCVVMDWVNVPIVYGQTYRFVISAPFYVYWNSGETLVAQYSDQNVGDKVVGEAVVILQEGETLQDLLNLICSQIRIGNFITSAIGFVRSPHVGTVNGQHYSNHVWGGGDYWGGTWGGWTVQGGIPLDPDDHLTQESEIGVVLQFGGAGGVNFSEITIGLTIDADSSKKTTFKSGTQQLFGIAYYDRANRCGAVNTSVDCVINVPTQASINPGYEHHLYLNYIKWSISHTPPIWATHYRWLRASKTSYSYYIQCPVANISFPSRIQAFTGNFLALSVQQNFTETKEDYGKFNIAAYSFEPGDRLRFVLKGGRLSNRQEVFTPFTADLDFEIVSVETPLDTGAGETYRKDELSTPSYITDNAGNKVKDPALTSIIIPYFSYEDYGIDATSLEDNKVIVEIYRPSKSVENPVYYEMSEKLDILNPHTGNRLHAGGTDGVISGWDLDQTSHNPARGMFIRGDAYVYNRFMYNENFGALFPCESQFYSDWYNSEFTDIGRPNIGNRDAARQRYRAKLLYSGVYIENTRINDLSKVNSSDSIALAEKYGAINFVKENGYTLKVLQTTKPTSLFIGREGLMQAKLQGQDVLASKDQVLSTPIVSEEDYGTLFATGCTKYVRHIYFYDPYNGAILRDASNGMFPISDYGIKDFLRDKSKKFINIGLGNLSVYSTFDETHNLVFFSFIDGSGNYDPTESFTIAFHEPTNKWISFYDFEPDFYGSLGSTITSFKDNTLWVHNQGTRMNFYGQQYTQRVKVVSNKDPLKVKAFRSVMVDSNQVWNAGENGDILVTESGMQSKLPESWFEQRERKYYAELGRNMLTSGVTASNEDLINGETLRGSSMSINLRNESTDETKLFGVAINSTYSPKSGI
jgi:hypothetical protein